MAQLDVNNRFALFFPEKRPFFLEGHRLLRDAAAGGVHAHRRGSRGRARSSPASPGRNALGVFVARDEVNNLLLPSNQVSDFVSLDQSVWNGVLRVSPRRGQRLDRGLALRGPGGRRLPQPALGVDAFCAGLDTDTLRFSTASEHRSTRREIVATQRAARRAPRRRRVLRRLRPPEPALVSGSLRTRTSARDFRADSGFIPRVDVRTFGGHVRPRPARPAGPLVRADRSAAVRAAHRRPRRAADGPDARRAGDLQRPDAVAARRHALREPNAFRGVTYELDPVDVRRRAPAHGRDARQPDGHFGDALDFRERGAGETGSSSGPSSSIASAKNVELRLSHNFERLRVAAGRVFTANLTQGRLVYYFGTRAFARAILQYLRHRPEPSALPRSRSRRETKPALLAAPLLVQGQPADGAAPWLLRQRRGRRDPRAHAYRSHLLRQARLRVGPLARRSYRRGPTPSTLC